MEWVGYLSQYYNVLNANETHHPLSKWWPVEAKYYCDYNGYTELPRLFYLFLNVFTIYDFTKFRVFRDDDDVM